MGLKKGVLVLLLIVSSLWLSLIAVLLFVDVVILNYIGASWLRSILGMAVYFTWLVAWYLILKSIFRYKVGQNSEKT